MHQEIKRVEIWIDLAEKIGELPDSRNNAVSGVESWVFHCDL
jgi:hypothetical protein